MRVNVGQRLVPLSTLGVGMSLIAIVFAISLYAFGSYIGKVSRDANAIALEATDVIRALPAQSGASTAAHSFAARLIQPALLVVFADERMRAIVMRTEARGGPTHAIVELQTADDRRLPEAHGLAARAALGLATAFGLRTIRTRALDLDVTVSVNEPRLVDDVTAFAPAFAVALVVSLALAAFIARAITRAALRPLTSVTRALERFSAGDFTPETIESDGGHQLGALAIAYNGAVEQVERAFAERAHANAVMRQFIADGSHQLRTPLTVIRGFVGILRSSGATMEPAELEHVLSAMAQQTLVMSDLIDKLILLERWGDRDAGDREVVDLSALCHELVSPIALAYPTRDIRLIAEGPIPIRADRSDVAHAISNVLDNALKYTNGAVSIEVEARDAGTRVLIEDDGPGMSVADADRAFDRFFRGRQREIKGSGLGLAIAKRAVERSGGTIALASDPQAGTRIALVFESDLEDVYPE